MRLIPIVSFLVAIFAFSGCSHSQSVAPQKSDAAPELVLQLGHSGAITSVTFSKDGKTLFSQSQDGEIRIWDIETGESQSVPVAKLADDETADFFTSAGHLITSRAEKNLSLRNLQTGQLRHTLPVKGGSFFNYACSANGSLLAVADFNQIQLVDLQTIRLRPALKTSAGGWYQSLSFSRDGRRLAVATSSDGYGVSLWDTRTNRLLRKFALPSHQSDRSALTALSPDGAKVAIATVGEESEAIRLYDAATGKVKRQILISRVNALHGVSALQFSPNGATLAIKDEDPYGSSRYGEIRLLDIATGRVRRIPFLTGPQREVAYSAFMSSDSSPTLSFSPDGSLVAVGTDDPGVADFSIKLFETGTGKLRRVFQGRRPEISDLAFSADGGALASAHRNAAWLWNLSDGHLQAYLPLPDNWFPQILFALDGKSIVTAGITDKLQTWTVPEGKLQQTLKGRWPTWTSPSFSPDGKTLAAVNFEITDDWLDRPESSLYFWETSAWRLLRQRPTDGVGSINYLSRQNSIATISSDENTRDTLRIWNHDMSKLLKTVRVPRRVEGLALCPSNENLIAGRTERDDGEDIKTRVILWESGTGKIIRSLPAAESYATLLSIRPLAFSPDGKMLAAEDLESINLWSPQTGKLLKRLSRHRQIVLSLVFNNKSTILASASNDGVIKLWDIHSGRLLLTLQILSPPGVLQTTLTQWIAFTPDGFYDGSAGVEKFIRWRVGDKLFPAAQYGSSRHRPDMVQKALEVQPR